MTQTRETSPSGATTRLLRALAVMASGTMVSRVLGLVRVMLTATVIGNASRQADIYAVALTIPAALYILFAGGALNSVLVPQLARAAKNDDDGGEAYTNRITTAFLTILGIVTVVATLAAPAITWVYAAPVWRTPEMADHYRAMVVLTMVCLPEVFFYGAFVVFGQILNARDKFGPMMWAPVASNILQIASFLVFWAVWGISPGEDPFSGGQIAVLGGGYLAGSILQAAVLVYFLRKMGYRYRPRFDLKGTGLGKTFKLAGWALGFVLVNQIALVVVSRLATSAPAGGEGAGLNVYNNAYLLFLLPHSLITVSLATAMVSSASRLAAEGNLKGTAAEVMRTMRLVTTALVPAALLLIALAEPMTELMFGNLRDDAHFVAWTVMAFGVGLVPFTIQHVCLRTYYALERNKDTFFLQILIASVQIGMSLLLILGLEIATPATTAPLLALSLSIAYLVGLFVSFRHLRKFLPALNGNDLFRHIVRVTVAIVPGALAAWFIADRLGTSQPMRLIGLALAGIVAAAGYLLLARVFHIDEVMSIIRQLRGRRGGDAESAATDEPGVHGEEQEPFESEIAPPYDPDAPTVARPAADIPTRAIPAQEREASVRVPVDPDAPTYAYSVADDPVDEDAVDEDPADEDPDDVATDEFPIDPDDAEANSENADPDAVDPDEEITDEVDEPDTAEELHPIRARAGQLLGGRYELEELLVRRTETETWRAHDQTLSRPVLIHLVPEGESEELIAAAKRAAVATDSRFLRVLDARLGDPGNRSEAGDDDDRVPDHFIVCEYAPGHSLEWLLASGPLSALEAAWVVREVADGLAGMHEQGLYHERINPDTIIITAAGNIKIVGFLLESELAPVHDHPMTDGSDPEAVDVADLGRLLYCTLVSRWPGGHAHGMASAPFDSEGQLLTPRQVRAGVSPALDTICDRILSPTPRHRETRLTTAQDVVQALNQILGTADASQDLERRLHYPVPVVEMDDEPEPEADPETIAAIDTAAGLPLAPLADPDAPTGRIPVVTDADEETTGPIEPLSPVTPAEDTDGWVAIEKRSFFSDGEVRRDPPRRWIPLLVLLTILVMVGSLIAVAMNLAPGQRTAPPPSEPTRWTIVSAQDFDPRGNDRQENPDTVPRAHDDNPDTAWTTVQYRNADMDKAPDGVGLIFDLGEVRQVSRADITLAGAGTSLAVRIPAQGADTLTEAPTTNMAQWRTIADANAAPAVVTLTPTEPVRTRFVLVALTELPSEGPGFRGGIAEAVFWG